MQTSLMMIQTSHWSTPALPIDTRLIYPNISKLPYPCRLSREKMPAIDTTAIAMKATANTSIIPCANDMTHKRGKLVLLAPSLAPLG